jgi:hypothetical protein
MTSEEIKGWALGLAILLTVSVLVCAEVVYVLTGWVG